jgi:hypothetical protein
MSVAYIGDGVGILNPSADEGGRRIPMRAPSVAVVRVHIGALAPRKEEIRQAYTEHRILEAIEDLFHPTKIFPDLVRMVANSR